MKTHQTDVKTSEKCLDVEKEKKKKTCLVLLTECRSFALQWLQWCTMFAEQEEILLLMCKYDTQCFMIVLFAPKAHR